MTPEWIAELSREDRNRIDNGIYAPLMTHDLSRTVGYLRGSIAYLRESHAEQPSAVTLAAIETLEAHIELLDDRATQINAKRIEWKVWRAKAFDCIHGVIAGCDTCRPTRPARKEE